jgi:hypothetical protein
MQNPAPLNFGGMQNPAPPNFGGMQNPAPPNFAGMQNPAPANFPGMQNPAPANFPGMQNPAPDSYARMQNAARGGGRLSEQAVPTGTQSPAQTDYKQSGNIPAEMQERAAKELNDNERIVWLGRPNPTIIFTRNVGVLIVGVVMLAVALLSLIGAATSHGNVGIALVFILIGAILVLGPLYRWKTAGSTCYILTNRRAIILKQGLTGVGREVYTPAEVCNMRRQNCLLFRGAGDLIFRSVTKISTRTTNSTSGGRARGGGVRMNKTETRTTVTTTHYGFLAVDGVDEPERMVRETLIDRFVDKLNEANELD